MTVVEFSNPHRVAELPEGHPPALLDNSPDVGEQLNAWYRWAATQGEQVLLRPGMRDYRVPRPIVFDAPNVSIVGHAAGGTRFITPSMTIGAVDRSSERREFGNFWVMSPEFYSKGQDGFYTFKDTGLTFNNLFRGVVHDIAVHGYGTGFLVQNGTARSHFDRLLANHCRSAGFLLRGSNTTNMGASGREWLADCRWDSCETDGNWEAGYICENGWLFEGNAIGDQFLDQCGALSCKVGIKVKEPVNVGGYRLNLNFVQCFADYCNVAAFDIRDFAEFKWQAGFTGVRGGVLVRCKRAYVTDIQIGNMRDGAGVRDGLILSDCDDLTVRGNKIRSFGRGVNVIRGKACDIDGNSVSATWDGSPSTADGHGIKLADGIGHHVRNNRIDDAGNKLAGLIVDERGVGSKFTANYKMDGTPIQVGSAPPIG